MVIVPARWLVPALAATVKATVPFPVALLPEVIVIQLTLLAAVQLQPLEEGVTLTVPGPPVEANDWPAGGDCGTVYTTFGMCNVPPAVLLTVVMR